MAILKICKYGNRILRHKTAPVTNIDQEIKRLIKDMFETMYSAGGIGLAANQAGVDLCLAVIDLQPEGKRQPLVIINPKITSTSRDIEYFEEGCLSLPGLHTKFKRPAKVTVTAMNEHGLPVKYEATGLFSRCLQHEIDHLNGRLIIDRVSLSQKVKVWRELTKLKKQWTQ